MNDASPKIAVISIAVAIVTGSFRIATAQSDQVERAQQVLQDGAGEVRDAAGDGIGDVAGSTDEQADEVTDADLDVGCAPDDTASEDVSLGGDWLYGTTGPATSSTSRRRDDDRTARTRVGDDAEPP